MLRSWRLRGTLRTNTEPMWCWENTLTPQPKKGSEPFFCVLNLHFATCCVGCQSTSGLSLRLQLTTHTSAACVTLSASPSDKQRYFWSPNSTREEKNNVSWLRRLAADGPTMPDSWIQAVLMDTPSLLTRGTAATLAKCILWAAGPNPCLTLADKPCYG